MIDPGEREEEQSAAPAPPPAAADPLPPFAAVLEQRLNGDRKLGLRIITIFIEDTAKRLAAIGQSLAAGNFEESRLQAHALAGSTAVIGAQEILLAVRSLEGHCRNEELAPAQGQLKVVDGLFAEIQVDLEKIAAAWERLESGQN